MNEIKVALFDMDGTLVDSMPYWAASVVQILEEDHVPYPADIVRILTPLGYIGSARYYINQLGMTDSEETLVQRMQDNAYPKYRDLVQPKPFVKEYLQTLRAQGVRCCVLTASPHLTTDICLQRNGLYNLFEQVWCADDFGLTKDNPEIYRQVAQRLECAAHEIRFFDDNLLAVQTAKAAGLETVGVYDLSSKGDREAIAQIADRYITSFEELL